MPKLTTEYLATITDLSLRRKIILREFIKCRKDPIYCIETYFILADAETGKKENVKLYDFQKTAILEYESYNYNLTMKSRQMGFTTVSCLYCAWYMLSKQNMIVNALANKLKTSKKFLFTVRMMLDEARKQTILPETKGTKDEASWLVSNYEADNNAKESFGILNGTRIQAESNNPEACRGETINLLFIDEITAIDGENPGRMEVIWSSAGITLTRSRGKCIGITTPKGASGWYFDQYTNAESYGWNVINAHWTAHPEYSKGMYKWHFDSTHPEGGYVEMFNELWPRSVDKQSAAIYKTRTTYNFIKDGKTRSPWYDVESRKLGARRTSCELDCSFAGSGGEVLDPTKVSELIKIANEYKPINLPEKGMLKSYKQFALYNPKHTYVLSCLPKGEKVLTSNGLKNIESVSTKDQLIDKDGNLVNILNFQKKNGNHEVYEFTISNTSRKTTFTYNHPLYISKDIVPKRKYTYKNNKKYFHHSERDLSFDFIDASNVVKKDWVKFPNTYKDKICSIVSLKKQLEIHNHGVRVDRQIDSNVILTEDFWWYIGIWLAEGWVGHSTNTKEANSCQTAHHINEIEYIEKIARITKEKFNRKVCYSTHAADNSRTCIFSNEALASFIGENFEKGAKYKFISEWVKYIPNNLKSALLEGYFNGDGSYIKQPLKTTVNFASSSELLLEGIQDLLFSLNIISQLQQVKKKRKGTIKGKKEFSADNHYHLNLGQYDTNLFCDLIKVPTLNNLKEKTRKTSNCYFSEDKKYIYFQVKKVKKKKYSGIVYNFETETHTYLTRHITTHNCDVATGDGSDFSGFIILDTTVMEIVATYKEDVEPIFYAEVISNKAFEFGGCMVIVESQGPGLTVLLELKDRIKYKNLYYHTLKKTELNKTQKRKLGFWQSNSTRQLGGDKIEELIGTDAIKIYSLDLLHEFHTWIWDKDGKRRHAPGKHDDLIMALSMALFYTFFVKVKPEQQREMLQRNMEIMQRGNWGKVTRTSFDDTRDLWSDLYD